MKITEAQNVKLQHLKEDYQKKLSEFSKVKRELKKFEEELYIEKQISYWFYGDPKNDYGYAIWHICDKSSPTSELENIKLMLEKGANINHICEGKTPLDAYTHRRLINKELKTNIKIFRELGALTKKELDNLKSNN